jgi:tRNA (cytidine32/uridine32-2'-O)-methyltransferase
MLENFRFVLVRPRNSGNIGSSLRAIANFGFRDLAVVNMWKFDEEEASMMAASTSVLLDKIKFFDSLDEAIGDRTIVIGTSAHKRGKHRRISMEDFRKILRERPGEKYAILFGSEKTGLTTEELERCDYYLRIDTDPQFSSLNLAQSVAIIAYEIRSSLVKEPEILPPQKIEKSTIEKIVEYVKEISELTEAPDSGKNNIIRTLRGVLGRSNTTQREGKILLWFVRHIWWYLSTFCKGC